MVGQVLVATVFLVISGWLAVRPETFARAAMREQLRMWGGVFRRWPRFARAFGVLVEDGEPRWADVAKRDWVRWVRVFGILSALFALLAIADGIWGL
jgi:hypothetical protein